MSNCGIDISIDGEIARENYTHYPYHHLYGFDFHNLTERPVRNGNYVAHLPVIVCDVTPRDTFLPRDLALAQTATKRPIKITRSD